MLFYIILIALIFLLINIKGRYAPLSFNVAYFIIIFISIFRFDVGYDYPAYYNTFYPTSLFGGFEEIDIFEPFSRQLIILSRLLGSPYWIMALFGILTYFFVYITIKDWKYRGYALLIYVCFLWLPSTDIIRQSLAISIILYAYKYVIQKKFIKYLIFVLLAIMFHTSALIGIAIYLIYNIPNLKVSIIILTIGIIICPVIMNFFSQLDFYSSAINNVLENNSGNKLILFYVLLFFCVCLFVWNNHNYDEWIYKTLVVISFSFIFFVSLQGMTAWRIGLYFISLYIYILPKIIQPYNADIKCLFSLFLIAFFLTTLYFSTFSKRSPYIPYDMIFFHMSNSYPSFRGFY